MARDHCNLPLVKRSCCLLVQIQKKKATGKGKKPGVRTSRVPTFFDFFSPAVVPDSEDELTPEQMENLQESLEQDYELGYAFAKPFLYKVFNLCLSMCFVSFMFCGLHCLCGACCWAEPTPSHIDEESAVTPQAGL